MYIPGLSLLKALHSMIGRSVFIVTMVLANVFVLCIFFFYTQHGSRGQASVQQAFRRKDYMTGCPRDNGYFGSTRACDEFYMCINSTAYRLYCDRGYQWSGQAASCVAKYDSDCGKVFECPVPMGLYRNPDDCYTYYSCAYGVPYLMDCPAPLQWSTQSQRCEWEENSDCGRQRPNPPIQSSPLPVISTTTISTETTRPAYPPNLTTTTRQTTATELSTATMSTSTACVTNGDELSSTSSSSSSLSTETSTTDIWSSSTTKKNSQHTINPQLTLSPTEYVTKQTTTGSVEEETATSKDTTPIATSSTSGVTVSETATSALTESEITSTAATTQPESTTKLITTDITSSVKDAETTVATAYNLTTATIAEATDQTTAAYTNKWTTESANEITTESITISTTVAAQSTTESIESGTTTEEVTLPTSTIGGESDQEETTTTSDPEKYVCPQNNGFFADPTSCEHYFLCRNGEATRKQCPIGKQFSSKELSCNWPVLSDCGQNK